ncbi:MAG TPA: sulfatase-like hydrolase/transferase [Thermoanaerobaculia bacterium]
MFTLICAGCSRHTPERHAAGHVPVILISIDTLRADHLPIYGYRSVATPNIDALAQDGIVFNEVWSHCPMTLPSHVTMLTGELPTTHGVRNNLGFRYEPSKHVSLPQRLQSAGYSTGAAVSSYVLRGETGLRDAFQWYEDAVDPAPGARFREYQRSGFTTTSLAKKWVDSVATRPFFLFLHLYEPHVPYDPPEPFRSRYAGNPYDGEIATADAIVGELIAHLKQRSLYDNAIIVLTSDHGEGLGDHGEAQHSILLYTEAIRVPLVIKLPHSESHGKRSSSPAALSDIVPTVASLVGLDAAKSDGIDLFAAAPRSRMIYTETIYPYVQLGWSDLRSIVSGSLQYIQSPRPELYDFTADPHERRDVMNGHRREAAALRGELDKFPPPTTGDVPIDPNDAARLAALGYIGSARQRPDPGSLPNPRDVIGRLEDIRIAYQLANERRYAEAAKKMNALLAENPRLLDLRVRLAEMDLDIGRVDDAIREYKTAIGAAGVFPSEIVASLADAYLQAGRLDEAQQAADAAMKGSPDRARRIEVSIALARKDLNRAQAIAKQLTDSAGDLLLRAQIRNAAGDAQGALQLLAQADARAKADGEKGTFGLESLRGDILARLGRNVEAVSAYQKEIALFPTDRIAYARLAVLYFVMGDRVAVDRTLERLVAANPTRPAYALAARTLEAVEDVSGARRWRARMPPQ